MVVFDSSPFKILVLDIILIKNCKLGCLLHHQVNTSRML